MDVQTPIAPPSPITCSHDPHPATAPAPSFFCRSMLRSSGDNEESRAQATRFEAEVERKTKALLKANRKLAKDVTRWVDASMAKHEEVSLKGDAAELPPPPARQEREGGSGGGEGGGGVEETKGGGRTAGDGADGGVKSWLGGWIR